MLYYLPSFAIDLPKEQSTFFRFFIQPVFFQEVDIVELTGGEVHAEGDEAVGENYSLLALPKSSKNYFNQEATLELVKVFVEKAKQIRLRPLLSIVVDPVEWKDSDEHLL